MLLFVRRTEWDDRGKDIVEEMKCEMDRINRSPRNSFYGGAPTRRGSLAPEEEKKYERDMDSY